MGMYNGVAAICKLKSKLFMVFCLQLHGELMGLNTKTEPAVCSVDFVIYCYKNVQKYFLNCIILVTL